MDAVNLPYVLVDELLIMSDNIGTITLDCKYCTFEVPVDVGTPISEVINPGSNKYNHYCTQKRR